MIRSLDSFRARVVSVEPTSVHFTAHADGAFVLAASAELAEQARAQLGREVEIEARTERDGPELAIVGGTLTAVRALLDGPVLPALDAWWASWSAAREGLVWDDSEREWVEAVP